MFEQRQSASELSPDQLLTKKAREFLRSSITSRFHDQFRPDQIEDIVQLAWMNAHEDLGTYKRDAQFKTWLTRIAINAALDYRRRLKTAKRGSGMAHAELDERLVPDETSGQKDWEALEDLDRRFQALDSDEQSIMRLRADDLGDEEIAQRLGMNVGTVKSKSFKARRKMRGEEKGAENQ